MLTQKSLSRLCKSHRGNGYDSDVKMLWQASDTVTRVVDSHHKCHRAAKGFGKLVWRSRRVTTKKCPLVHGVCGHSLTLCVETATGHLGISFNWSRAHGGGSCWLECIHRGRTPKLNIFFRSAKIFKKVTDVVKMAKNGNTSRGQGPSLNGIFPRQRGVRTVSVGSASTPTVSHG